jgi:hypothetical protein
MVNPANLFRMMTEMIFVLLGGVLVWVGLNRAFLFDPRKPAWLLLGAVLMFWGARTWVKTIRAARSSDRTAVRIGAASLVLVGLMMLGLNFVPFRLAGFALAATGGVLVLRGLLSAGLALGMD